MIPLAARPGPHVFGQARHRDGVRSTHRDTAYRWGHPWGVVSGLVQWPGAVRPWALPVWVAWYRSPEWAPAHGTRHQTPAHLTRRLLARLIRWLPARRCIVGGETGYGTSETARFCGKPCRPLPLVSPLSRDAALYEPPPPRTPRTMGRPRVPGRTLASPHEVVAQTPPRMRLTGPW